MTMGVLDGKVALITGAGSRGGQGEAEARLFAEEGAFVIVTDLVESAGSEIAAEIGSQAVFIPLDVRDADAWRSAANIIVKRHGRIDILINNAGVWLGKPLLETSPEEFRSVVETNQTGVFLGMSVIAPIMKELGTGSIVNTCSTAGLKGGGMPLAYAASKWAVRGMTRAAAWELAPFGIRVNAVCPGVIDTPMIEGGKEVLDYLATLIPSGKIGTPQEVARLVLFLAGDASSYVSGAEITVDSAFTA
jgi:3alpha(or 20beta)-hydroxysteroid dehydrogenase